MWDQFQRFSRGRISLRDFSFFATSLIVAILAFALTGSQPVFAGTATWKGNDLIYQSHTYAQSAEVTAGDMRIGPGNSVFPGMQAFQYVDTTAHKAYVAFFPHDTTPAQATTALLVGYDYAPPSQYTGSSPPQTITITPASTAAPVSSVPGTTCDSKITGGIGWILCPVSNYLATAVDGIYSVIESFLNVSTISGDTTSSIYQLWSLVRSIANVCFVIAFLFVIYAQMTGAGSSKYHLVKVMLPRLLLAAVLVNASYWISALAVDISNLLGYSIEAVFSSIRQSVATGANVSWSQAAGYILSGGAVGVVGFAAVTGGSFAAAGFLLLSLLIGVAFSALAAFIVLAARQAIITVLIIISPLAFVAYVLPNTEKYFGKWRDTLMNLLVMFPIFSALFGGAQLAGAAIIQNAHGSMMIVLIGMGAQVAPLAVTPMLTRISKGALGQIASMASSQTKKIAGQAGGWAKGQSEYHKDRALGSDARGWMGARRLAQFNADRNVNQERRREGFKNAADVRARSRRGYQKTDTFARDMDAEKQNVDSRLQGSYDRYIRTDSKRLQRELQFKATSVGAELQKEKLAKMHAEVVAKGAKSQHLRGVFSGTELTMALASANRVQRSTEEIAYTGMAKRVAEKQHQDNIAKALLNNVRSVDGVSIREYAGGVGGTQGQNAALAYAVATKRKQFGESVDEMNQLIKHFNPSSEALQELVVKGKAARGTDSDGRHFEFTPDNIYAMEAAVENQITIGTVDMVDQVLELSGSTLAEYRTTISSALAKAGHTGRSIYQGGALINEVAKGTITSHDDLISFVQKTIADGKFSDEQLATMDKGALDRFLEAASRPAIDSSRAAALARGVDSLKLKAENALTDSRIKTSVKDNASPVLESIRSLP